MNPSLFSDDVREFMRILHAHEVRYLLVGGVAVIFHGYARMTGDADFLFDHGTENVERLWRALLEFWGGKVPSVTSAAELTNPNLVVQFGRPPNRIDLIASLPSVPFEDAWRTRVQESLEIGTTRVPVWIIGLDALRRAKRAAGRPKDLDDLQHLPGT